jgi:hypothetical protein
MHSFHDLDLTTLKKVCSKYNLHVKITKYSKLSKEELIPHMEKHLHITENGKIKLKKEVSDMVENELSKLIDDLKNKVKEVKEKVKKQMTKKEQPKEEEKNINIEVKPKKEKMTVKEVKAEAKKQGITLTKKVNGKPVSKSKTDLMNEMKEMKPKKEIHIEEKPKEEDYSHLEPEHRELYKEYHPLYKMVKAKLDDLKPFLETLTLITSRRGQPKTEWEKLSHYFNIETSDSSKNGIEYSVRALKHLDKKLDEFKLQKAFHDIQPKEEKKKEMPEKNNIVEKVDNLQNELNKLEQLIKIDEKQNEKEHKEMKKEIKGQPELKKEKKIFTNLEEYKNNVKKIYKKKALELHPDKNIGNEEQSKKKFQNLKNAYDKKMNEIKKLEEVPKKVKK